MTLLLFNLYTIPLILKMSYTPQVLHVVSDDLVKWSAPALSFSPWIRYARPHFSLSLWATVVDLWPLTPSHMTVNNGIVLKDSETFHLLHSPAALSRRNSDSHVREQARLSAFKTWRHYRQTRIVTQFISHSNGSYWLSNSKKDKIIIFHSVFQVTSLQILENLSLFIWELKKKLRFFFE